MKVSRIEEEMLEEYEANYVRSDDTRINHKNVVNYLMDYVVLYGDYKTFEGYLSDFESTHGEFEGVLNERDEALLNYLKLRFKKKKAYWEEVMIHPKGSSW